MTHEHQSAQATVRLESSSRPGGIDDGSEAQARGVLAFFLASIVTRHTLRGGTRAGLL
jgi:hypothetical protein